MPITYPAAPATLTGDVLTINRFLNSPTLVQRRLRTLAENRFIADALLQGRPGVSGGAVLVETSEGIFADRASDPQGIEPGAEYPLTTVSTGIGQLLAVTKRGLDTVVTDEAIRRQGFNPVDRALTKLVNTIVRDVDGIAMAALRAALTTTSAAAGAWDVSTTLVREIATAKATIAALNMGYDPDTLVVSDLKAAQLTSNDKVLALLPRESRNDNPIVVRGLLSTILNLDILVTPNMPVATEAFLVDRKVLGGMAEEVPLYSKSIREDLLDRWRLRAGRIVVPYIQEPGAGVRITGI